MIGDPKNPKQQHSKKLVHITGKTHNDTNLCDIDFGVIAQDSYRLKRKVEMFQWQESFHQVNQREYFTYTKAWSETPIDSRTFKNTVYANPNLFAWPYRSTSLQSNSVMLGLFHLNESQVARLGAS